MRELDIFLPGKENGAQSHAYMSPLVYFSQSYVMLAKYFAPILCTGKNILHILFVCPAHSEQQIFFHFCLQPTVSIYFTGISVNSCVH